MASYSSPSVANVLLWTGINTNVLENSQVDLETMVSGLMTLGEASIALMVGASLFDSTSLVARQVTALQQAVAFQVAADFLRNPELRRVTGSHAPLLFEDGSDINESIGNFTDRVRELVSLLQNGSQFIQDTFQASLDADTEDLRVFTREMVW